MNKETLQNYNTRININNNKLSGILEAINNLPEAGGGEELPAELNIKVDQLTTDGYVKEITITGTSDTLPPYCFTISLYI